VSAGELILATGIAPAAPASGRVTLYAENDNKLYLRDSSGIAEQVWSGGGNFFLWRNALINGSFAIWQRQSDPATATQYSDDAYCADRWYALTESGPIDAQRIDGDTQRYAARLTQKQATAQQIGLAQIIEGANCQHLRGQEVTFPVRVRCSAAKNISFAVLQWDGGEDSVTSDVVATWDADPTLITWVTDVTGLGQYRSLAAGAWADVSATVTLGSTFTNLIVIVWAEALSQNTTLDLEAAQLERGGAATPFEVRPVGAELALCQRYCYVLAPGANGSTIGLGAQKDTRFVTVAVPIPYMRVTPTFSHNVSGWDNATSTATGTNLAGYNWVSGSPFAIQTSGTIDSVSSFGEGRFFAQVQVRATTSFDGNGGDDGDLRVGADVRFVWDGDM
jgi:hypothetical protein